MVCGCAWVVATPVAEWFAFEDAGTVSFVLLVVGHRWFPLLSSALAGSVASEVILYQVVCIPPHFASLMLAGGEVQSQGGRHWCLCRSYAAPQLIATSVHLSHHQRLRVRLYPRSRVLHQPTANADVAMGLSIVCDLRLV